jgi:long-chain-fatty-acid--CoA ligase ACSBG
MLSHDNFTFTSVAAMEYLPGLEKGHEVIVSYLPLSHVAAQTLDIFVTLTLAATVYFADKDALKGTLLNTLHAARPTVFLGVPRVYEKIQEKMMKAGADAGYLKRSLGAWAKNVTLNYHMDRKAGNQYTSLQYILASKLVLNKVKTALGFDRTKFMFTGAAACSLETKKYFLSLDMSILEAYGMSESSGCHSIAQNDDPDFESIGKPLPGEKNLFILILKQLII